MQIIYVTFIIIIIYSDSDWNDGESNIPPTSAPSSPYSVNVDCKICIITTTNTHCTVTLIERLIKAKGIDTRTTMLYQHYYTP